MKKEKFKGSIARKIILRYQTKSKSGNSDHCNVNVNFLSLKAKDYKLGRGKAKKRNFNCPPNIACASSITKKHTNPHPTYS